MSLVDCYSIRACHCVLVRREYELQYKVVCCIRDVVNCQFTKSIVLPESCLHDSIMCGMVTDIDWDGTDEIILGTYGRRLLIYKSRMTQGPGVCTLCVHGGMISIYRRYLYF